MNKYLLSNGLQTTDVNRILDDIFNLNFSINKGTIYNSSIGISLYFNDFNEEIIRTINSEVKFLINRVNEALGVKLNLDSLIPKDNNITISIKDINNSLFNYTNNITGNI